MKISAIIEIQKGSTYKYEYNQGLLELERVVPIPYPHNYGFMPSTLAGDGDPLDVFIISREPILPLSQVYVSIIGALLCDDNGEEDHKLIGIFSDMANTTEIEKDNVLSQLETFLSTYKPGFTVLNVVGQPEAQEIIKASQRNYIVNLN